MIAFVIATGAILVIGAYGLAARLDQQARRTVHPEFTTISVAFCAYAASRLLALALLVAVAITVIL